MAHGAIATSATDSTAEACKTTWTARGEICSVNPIHRTSNQKSSFLIQGTLPLHLVGCQTPFRVVPDVGLRIPNPISVCNNNPGMRAVVAIRSRSWRTFWIPNFFEKDREENRLTTDFAEGSRRLFLFENFWRREIDNTRPRPSAQEAVARVGEAPSKHAC